MAENKDNNVIPIWALEAIEIEKPDPVWNEKGLKEKEELLQLLIPIGIIEKKKNNVTLTL